MKDLKSDKKYYESRELYELKRRKALSKAGYRGKVSIEWHKTNKLNSETLPEFKKAMKKANKEWHSLNAL